jgi:hypothetical protein
MPAAAVSLEVGFPFIAKTTGSTEFVAAAGTIS